MTPRIIATARTYDELLAALRLRIAELNVSTETIDSVAGLPERYTVKLFAPVPVKGLGRVSMGLLLGALGLKLDVVVDDAAYARVRDRLVQRSCHNGGMRAVGRPQNKHFVGNSEWGRVMAARRTLLLTPAKRRQIAKIASKTRWANR